MALSCLNLYTLLIKSYVQEIIYVGEWGLYGLVLNAVEYAVVSRNNYLHGVYNILPKYPNNEFERVRML